MADRTSAELFGRIFDHLAQKPDDNRDFARWLFGFCGNYDFDYYQMGCDASLVTLGLARRGVNEDGDDVLVYGFERLSR